MIWERCQRDTNTGRPLMGVRWERPASTESILYVTMCEGL